MSNTPELLPCPFCGGEADFFETAAWWVRCDDCGGEAQAAVSPEEAARLWNRRAALQSAADTPAPQEHLAGTPEVELMRQKAISNARERNAALRAIQAALDDFELIVDRINAGQINRACATAMQGAKEAKLALAASAPEDALSPFKAKEE